MARSGTNTVKCAARTHGSWEGHRMRLLARTAVWTAAPALLLVAGCGVQPASEADDSQSVEVRSPQVTSAEHHDVSAPLGLIRPVPPSLEEREHPVKPVPRRFNHGARDPVVLYDPMADRWVISQFSVTTTPFLQCVAVSTTPDPTGSYARYSFQYANFPDYPKMGVWPDAYYQTFNLFNAAGTAFLGTQICAYDRTKMLTGSAATQQCFTTSTAFGGLLPADLDGARLPPAGSPNYIVGLGSA